MSHPVQATQIKASLVHVPQVSAEVDVSQTSTKGAIEPRQSAASIFAAFRSFTVMYLKDRQERRTAWFSRIERAEIALAIMKRAGYEAIIYCD